MSLEIQRDAWTRYRALFGSFFWPLMIILGAWSLVTLTAPPMAILPWIVFVLGYAYFVQRARRDFWAAFARSKGWHYAEKGSLEGEHAVMFTEGHSRKIEHVVSGKLAGRPFRIFEYSFKTGSGDQETTHHFTVYEMRYSGSFPHLYLDHKKHGRSIDVGIPIGLPAEFEKQFTLRGPKEYEIEALEIFTPDLLEFILAQAFQYDVELVEHEMLVFTPGQVDSLAELTRESAQAQALMLRLGEKLDSVLLEPIGDKPYRLERRRWLFR